MLPLLSVALGVLTFSLPAATVDDGPALLRQVASVYAAALTYEDTGVVLTHRTDGETPDEILFRTSFTRPNRLRFEWTRHHPYPPLRHKKNHAVIEPGPKGFQMLKDGETVRESSDLNTCVAGATGVSRGSAHHIPRLLISEIEGFSLANLSDVRLNGEELFEGVPCRRLQGNHPRGSKYELWIGQTDHLIRRIVRDGAGSSPSEEIRRDIRITGSSTTHRAGKE